MATVKDISVKEDGLQFKNGDFLIELSNNMHIQHILQANTGQYYQYPLIGVGIRNYIKSPMGILNLRKNIRLNVESDNVKINNLDVVGTIDDFTINLDAERKS